MNLSKNPAIAYQQGVQIGRARGTLDGINLVCNILLTCLYNANEELDEHGLSTLYTALTAGLERTIKGIATEHTLEHGLSTEDMTDLLVEHDNTIRKKLGLPIVDYRKGGNAIDI